MAQVNVETRGELDGPTQIARQFIDDSEAFPEQSPKLKGRARLVARLHRISSSQSIGSAGRARARTYTGSGKASVSCLSLSSAATNYEASFGSSLTSEPSNGYSTAPTSGANTPGLQIPQRTRVRALSNLSTKSSAAMPAGVSTVRPGTPSGIATVNEDYFAGVEVVAAPPRKPLNFWGDMPTEIRMQILRYLEPREVVQCSSVSKEWQKMCFDGQLWANLDTAAFYQDIPADALVRIITNAGPFVRDLNLRGCVQLRERWHAKGLSDACTNLENFSLQGCKIDRTAIHSFLLSNSRLVHVNLSGLAGATNSAMRIIASHCPKLEYLDVSWCNNIDTRGLRRVVEACPGLKDLRAGEVTGWEDVEFMQELFERNTLERLILMNCDSLTDESLAVLIEGTAPEVDLMSGRPEVPPRRLKHLDLTRCRSITDQGVRTFVNNLPEIEGLQLSKLNGIVDATLTELLPTTPNLTHLDLEELDQLSNAVLQSLASSPCASRLRHLSVSYCEQFGDVGMLAVFRTCRNLRSVDMDNTRISDLVLTEAAALMRERTPRTLIHDNEVFKPATGLRLVAYDCQNVTWTGVREVLSRNAEVFTTTRALELAPLDRPTVASSLPSASSSVEHISTPLRSTTPRIHVVREHSYPSEVIQLKCFYTYQPTVEEHTKRVMRGDFVSARKLERKWAEFMIAQEEAGAVGAGSRRRRRRAREAAMMHADEEESLGSGVGGGRRRRARSGGCAVM